MRKPRQLAIGNLVATLHRAAVGVIGVLLATSGIWVIVSDRVFQAVADMPWIYAAAILAFVVGLGAVGRCVFHPSREIETSDYERLKAALKPYPGLQKEVHRLFRTKGYVNQREYLSLMDEIRESERLLVRRSFFGYGMFPPPRKSSSHHRLQ